MTDQPTPAVEKLYAGKFKTVEELEAGYKNSLPTFQENENLKKQLNELSSVPAGYINPSDVQMETNRVEDIQARAREAGMTQAQYEKFLRGDKSRLDQYQSTFDAARKEVGEATLNVLSDYVTKNYPKEIGDKMLNTFITNKEMRASALAHRDQLLSNKVAGIGGITPPTAFNVTAQDIKKAYAAKESNRGDMQARTHYLNLIAAQAAQRSGA
jgi:hypothetical protein